MLFYALRLTPVLIVTMIVSEVLYTYLENYSPFWVDESHDLDCREYVLYSCLQCRHVCFTLSFFFIQLVVAEFVLYSKLLQVEQHLQLVDVVFGLWHAILPDMFGGAFYICTVSKFICWPRLLLVFADWFCYHIVCLWIFMCLFPNCLLLTKYANYLKQIYSLGLLTARI